MSFFLSLLCLSLLLITLLLMRKKKTEKHVIHLPPSPPNMPVIGNLHQIGAVPHRSLWRLSKKYGPVIMLKLGKVPTVIISSAEAAKEVLKVHDLECCGRPSLAGPGKLSYNYLDMAFAPYGDYWRAIRKVCAIELFSAKRVQSFRSTREEEVTSMIDSISKSSLAATPIDLSKMLFNHSASITCRASFGKGFQGSEMDGAEFQDLIHEAFAMLGSFSAVDFFPYVGWIVDRLTGLHDRLEKIFYKFDIFYQKVIDDHLKVRRREKQMEDIIDILLNLKIDQAGSDDAVPITHNHIKAILMNIFLGGVDTTALSVEWAMAELVRNPRVMAKAQQEIRSRIGDKQKVDEEDIEQLNYLKMVVKETLRLHPPATLLLPRETLSAVKINGYDIPEKSRIQINVWAIGRDPDLWESPEEFMPERFEDSPIDFKGRHFELLPFGAGRRGCPGLALGVTMIESTLANLLHCFDWKYPPGVEDIDMDEVAGLSVHKKTALVLVPTSRDACSKGE
uniref:Cytochrome P450 CYP71B101 n=1 Tax=Polygala tenuifolia TaxID=355332 RepID=A0A1Z2WUZ6_9FABA|nr:cytochrome P450 CYP71B101 [Polygala tenuifolia]